MSLHHVSIKVLNSLSHHRTLFPRSTPMFNAQAGVVLLLRVTHTDTELPHTLTGTLLMSQTGRDITPPLGQAVSSPLSYIPKTQSVWEVWTLKDLHSTEGLRSAWWESLITVRSYEQTHRDGSKINTSPEINVIKMLDVSLVSYQHCGKDTVWYSQGENLK